MTIFFDYKVAAPASSKPLALGWCRSQDAQPSLALSFDNNTVQQYYDEGERIEDVVLDRKTHSSSALDWHPKAKLLAMGWSDGTVSVWTEQDKNSQREDKMAHRAPVSVLKWSPHGTRMVSGDEQGSFGIWQCDTRGRFKCLKTIRKKAPITAASFRDSQLGQTLGPMSSEEMLVFYGDASGGLHYADDRGHEKTFAQLKDSVTTVLVDESYTRTVVAVTKTPEVAVYDLISLTGNAKGEVLKERQVMKFGAQVNVGPGGATVSADWVGPGLLAIVSGEGVVRIWDMLKDENYILSVSEFDMQGKKDERIHCLSFNWHTRVLACGTQDKVLMWRFVGGKEKSDKQQQPPSATADEELKDWEPMPWIGVGNGVHRLQWGPGASSVLAAQLSSSISILHEFVLQKRISFDKNSSNSGVSVMQKSADSLSIEKFHCPARSDSIVVSGVTTLKSSIRIKGIDVSGKHVVVWNGKMVEIFDVAPAATASQALGAGGNGAAHRLTSFPSRASDLAISGEYLYIAVDNGIEVCNLNGIIRTRVFFAEEEGRPCLVDASKSHLVVATRKGIFKVWDISRRELRNITNTRSFRLGHDESEPLIGVISSVRVNCNGSYVSFLASPLPHRHEVKGGKGLNVASTVFVYDVELDKMFHYSVGDERSPVDHYWDPLEPNMLSVEVRPLRTNVADDDTANVASAAPTSEVALLYICGDLVSESALQAHSASGAHAKGIILQGNIPIEDNMDSLMGVSVPRVYFLLHTLGGDDERAPTGIKGSPAGSRLMYRVMSEFTGMEGADADTRRNLLNFSYQLALGNMDEAYKSVKLIKSVGVWENMAQMCVKTRRLDVAEICLGHMKHATGSAAVRRARQEALDAGFEPDMIDSVALGMIAVQLGMIEDATQIYAGVGRYDLINLLHQASGDWDAAVQVAERFDRIHLRTTRYSQARHYESVGDTTSAIKCYEMSNTHKTEVPRMLFCLQQLDELAEYVKTTDDSEGDLAKWWAQYCESNGQYDKALQFYGRAGDLLSVVRVLCFQGEFERAEERMLDAVSNSVDANDGGADAGDAHLAPMVAAAAYHLARQYENQEKIPEAIAFFSRAGRFNHAVRLAREHGLDAELVGLAVQASPKVMREAAKHLEDKGVYDKAVTLYHKAGSIQKALELCFSAQLFQPLHDIADDIGPDADPNLQKKLADFFLQYGHFDKAVSLLLAGKQVSRALDLCVQHKVMISEEMADRMLKDANVSKEEKPRVQEKIARCCEEQGQYHLATKMYTLAGNRVKAMKTLIRSGDTEKIIKYAQRSRREPMLLKLAANYLQTLDWHNDGSIMEHIINFYTKAKAFENLSLFYDACAQVEIDEYRDYEKALGALKKALAEMEKTSGVDRASKEENLMSRITLVRKFVDARKLVKTDTAEMVKICHSLLDEPDVESAVRVGDVFALLIEFYHLQGNMEQAYHLIEKMRDRNIILSPYLDQDMVDSIYKAMGIEAVPEAEEEAVEGEDIADDVGEEIDEEVEDEMYRG